MAFPARSRQGTSPEEGEVNRTDPRLPRGRPPRSSADSAPGSQGPVPPTPLPTTVAMSPRPWKGAFDGQTLRDYVVPSVRRGRGKATGLAVLTQPRGLQGPSTRRRGSHAHAPCHAAPYSTFSPLDLNSMCRICDRHLPNSSRIICSARHSEQRSFSASSPCASRQAHAASTTSREMHDEGHLPETHRLRPRQGLRGSHTPVRFKGHACHGL